METNPITPRATTVTYSMDQRLKDIAIALQNAADDAVIKAELAAFGYNAAKVAEGKALYDQAEALHRKQKVEYGEQATATDALNTAWEAANDVYMRHVKVARVAFKQERGIQGKLGIEGQRKQTLAGWLGQAKQFYTAALAETALQTTLGNFGISVAKLTEAQTLVQLVEMASVTQYKEKGEAQEATRLRDEALEALYEWISDFKQIARVALQDQPNQLVKLRI